MIHGFVVCFWLVLCVARYVLCAMCCVVRWCVMRGGPFSCASSPAELWPLSNLPGKVFDRVNCTHHTST